jgi:c-di-GMP-related signal transduction protein
MSSIRDIRMELFVARQPIFDERLEVRAYELLFRSGQGNAFDGAEENEATSKVITAVFYSPGGEDILGGKQAFVNFPRGLLVNDGATAVPPELAVIEILETVEPGHEVVAACRRLRERGYQIALDDFVDTPLPHPLAPLADFIKVDLRATDRQERKKIVARYGRASKMLAEKVETRAEFRDAAAAGFTYFQGYFFAKPVITSTREIPTSRLNYLRILRELHQAELNVHSLSGLIAHEPSLAYKLLRFVNSALFGRRREIHSIEHTLLYIGENGVRKWLSVVLLMDLTSDQPGALVTTSLARARFCELLAPHAGLGSRAGDLFLAGVFSLLDAMLGRPLGELLAGLNLPEDVKNALLGKTTVGDRVGVLWETVLAYESANWLRADELAASLSIRAQALPSLYSLAVNWADEVTES